MGVVDHVGAVKQVGVLILTVGQVGGDRDGLRACGEDRFDPRWRVFDREAFARLDTELARP